MLLRLQSVGLPCAFATQIDCYVPFDIQFAGSSTSADELFYWRTVGQRHLLEIKVAASTGALCGVSCILAPREWTRRVESVLTSDGRAVERCEGVPIMDIAPWAMRLEGRSIGVDRALLRIDEEVPFVFAIGRDGISVRFEGPPEAQVVADGDLNVLFTSDGFLSGFVLLGLSEAELKLLGECYAP